MLLNPIFVFLPLNVKKNSLTLKNSYSYKFLSSYAPYIPLVVRPTVEVLLGSGTTPRSPYFVRVVHTTGG